MKCRCAPSPVYPSVTIGVPVYQGLPYLIEALDSLVRQDYPNLEISVSDNGSTDGTWELLQDYAARDDRFRLHRHPSNIGALPNFKSVLFNTDATYFMWAAHDDVWPAGFVSAAVAVLETSPDTVMVNALTKLIDEKGVPLMLPPSRPQLCDMRGMAYPARIAEMSKRVGWCLYGLMRRDALLRTCIVDDDLEMTFDVIMTYGLAGYGSFAVLDDFDFNYRVLPKTHSQSNSLLGLVDEKFRLPFTKMFRKSARAILTSPFGGTERAAACENFFRECATHEEWSSHLCAENGWPPGETEAQKIARLYSLL